MYAAKILADSVAPGGARLTTFCVTFPRLILAEVNTHRVLSRNSASSRAIPVEKQIRKVLDDPFIPEAWPTEQKGMSGGAPLYRTEDVKIAVSDWLGARDDAVDAAYKLVASGVHKSLVNRLLEPFMWHTAIISATEWSNFWALRTAENAQPEFRHIALMMKELYDAGKPRLLATHEWHLPLVTAEEMGYGNVNWQYWKQVSVGRCARVSFLTHDGVRDPAADVGLHDQLMYDGHMSPFEHQARPAYLFTDVTGNFKDWHQYRSDIPYQADFSKRPV